MVVLCDGSDTGEGFLVTPVTSMFLKSTVMGTFSGSSFFVGFCLDVVTVDVDVAAASAGTGAVAVVIFIDDVAVAVLVVIVDDNSVS